jgi:hypothetical protein
VKQAISTGQEKSIIGIVIIQKRGMVDAMHLGRDY